MRSYVRVRAALNLCGAACLLSGCALVETTYREVPPGLVTGLDLEADQSVILARLRHDWGHDVSRVWRLEEALELEGAEYAAGTVIAEVPSAADEAFRKTVREVVTQPSNLPNLVATAVGGAAILGLGVFGFRGYRRKKKRKAAA